jgi:tryptophanyl-tRNA synthetase
VQLICFECGATLTDEERHYYAGNCEECEREHHQRIADWRAGGEDPELSRVYGSSETRQMN